MATVTASTPHGVRDPAATGSNQPVARSEIVVPGNTGVKISALLDVMEEGRIDPSVIISHRMGLSQAPEAYARFAEESDDCIKVVLDPSA